MEVRKDILWRAYTIYFLTCLLGLGILFRVVHIQYVEGEKWSSRSAELHTKLKTIPAARGNIYAEDGRLLATSMPVYEVRMDPNSTGLKRSVFYKHVGALADSLADLTGKRSAEEWERELIQARKNGERYLLIDKEVDFNTVKRMKRFPIFRRGRYQGGFIRKQRNERKRPFKILASRTIGYKRPGVRPVGLEGAFNAELSGKPGKKWMKKISGGVWMPINRGAGVEPENGKDIRTTINVNFQDVAERVLMDQLQKHEADHGCAVLMEVETGYVKAIANLTKNREGEGYSEQYNYAIGESREPGSTFKLPAVMAALEDRKLDLHDSVDTEDGTHEYHDQVMRDSRLGGYGKISLERAFEVSSNVGISKLLHRSYADAPQQFIDRLHTMNLGQKLGLEIPGEGAPYIKDTDNESWSGVTLPWMSIGYEVRQTPLQILAFYNAVANDGKMVRPLFVKDILKGGEVVRQREPQVINDAICSRETVRDAQKLLKGVVKNGTAQNLKGTPYKIAGKTGTAQIYNDKYGYGYESSISYQATFVGYFPADDPKYSCIVSVNAPSKDVYYGNLVAGPIFREIADKVYANSIRIQEKLERKDSLPKGVLPVADHGKREPLKKVLETLNIPYENKAGVDPWTVAMIRKDGIEIAPRKVKPDKMPDVTGMGLQDAVFLLENMGAEVKVSGSGQVVDQSVEPGKPLKGEPTVKLTLS